MGGSGSGQWYRWSKRPTEENYHVFRMSRLCQEGVVKENCWVSGGWQWTQGGEVTSTIRYQASVTGDNWIRVYYTNTRTNEPYDYKIRLTYTVPHYGGKRWWFICPGSGCGRRVGVLFLGNVMVCRHCWGMAYSSQSKAYYDRQSDKAFQLAAKLGLEGSVLDGFYGEKPKRMHWKTYHKKVDELERLVFNGLMGAMAKFGNIF